MALMLPTDIEKLQHLQNEPSNTLLNTTSGSELPPNNPESADTTLKCEPSPCNSHPSNRESSPPPPLQHIGSTLSPRHSGGDFPPNLENADPKPPTSPPPNFTHIHAHLVIFSIFGTLARLGLNALTAYPASSIGGVVWANFAGCVVMGILVSDQARPLLENTRTLYVGLTTGFCGSLTSFSSFEYDAFRLLANVSPTHDWASAGSNVMALLAYVIATFALSLGGLQAGAHIASLLPREKLRLPRTARAVVGWGWGWGWFILPLSLSAWVGAVVMSVFLPHWRDGALFACVFAPVGVCARFWISRVLNPRAPQFPVGTFCCNILATAVLAGMGVGRARYVGVGCGVMKGVADGFCGCLSTVSTFVTELRGLRVKQAYVYAIVSMGVGLGVVVGVLGSWTWAKGGLAEFC